MTTSKPSGNHSKNQSDRHSAAREYLAQASAEQLEKVTQAVIDMERRRAGLPPVEFHE